MNSFENRASGNTSVPLKINPRETNTLLYSAVVRVIKNAAQSGTSTLNG